MRSRLLESSPRDEGSQRPREEGDIPTVVTRERGETDPDRWDRQRVDIFSVSMVEISGDDRSVG